jgi:EutQ-like cupin domain
LRAESRIENCTAGRFDWFYDVDETVYVLEGSVTIKNQFARRVYRVLKKLTGRGSNGAEATAMFQGG